MLISLCCLVFGKAWAKYHKKQNIIYIQLQGVKYYDKKEEIICDHCS